VLSRVGRLLLFLALMLVGLAVILLILQNPQQSQFHFLHWITPQLPFSILLIVAFLLGAFSSTLLGLWLAGRRKLGSLRLRRTSAPE
jgi:putative membrane protein